MGIWLQHVLLMYICSTRVCPYSLICVSFWIHEIADYSRYHITHLLHSLILRWSVPTLNTTDLILVRNRRKWRPALDEMMSFDEKLECLSQNFTHIGEDLRYDSFLFRYISILTHLCLNHIASTEFCTVWIHLKSILVLIELQNTLYPYTITIMLQFY
jgi:hypothetical protein